MNIQIFQNKRDLGAAAASAGADRIREVLKKEGSCSIILATGNSQFEVLEALLKQEDINWNQVNIFHLDEYVSLSINHPASFRAYLWKRFVSQLPVPPKSFHQLDAEVDPIGTCQKIAELIKRSPIEVAFVGIGENAHLAFNDPPANFTTTEPYLIVELDQACRYQQLGEGWFPSFEDVPKQAISMSIHQIMKSNLIICSVPDERKSEAVKNSLEGAITENTPASILQKHPNCCVFLDQFSASKLAKKEVYV